MVDKSFEHTVTFTAANTPTGTVWLPIVTVYLIQPNGYRFELPLLFDTGASVTTLRADLYPLLGIAAWNVGRAEQTTTANGIAQAYAYDGIKLEFLGKSVDCTVNLMQLRQNPLYIGLLGRAQIFDQFGFGFWESAHELYATGTP
jgi:hypothetical protein